MDPCEEVIIYCNRLYLQEAKKALAEVGGVYNPLRAELKAINFDDNISNIIKIIFTIVGYPQGQTKYTVDLSRDDFQIEMQNRDGCKILEICKKYNEPTNKKEFLEAIKKLWMGEWKSHYSTKEYGYFVCDGEQNEN